MATDLAVEFGKKDEDGKIIELGEVTIKVPETVEEAVQMWGGDVVLSKCIQSVKIDAQRIARAAESAEKAQEALASWTPGIARERAGGGISASALSKKLKELKASIGPDKLKEMLAAAGIEL